MNIVGGDFGRSSIKVFTGNRFVHFPAIVGEWRNLNLVNNYGSQAFEGVFKKEKFFAGVLAQNESEFARQMLIEDKVTQDTLLLALIALHQTGFTDFDLVTGLPVNLHSVESKKALTDLLMGTHEIEVNGELKKLTIHRVRVAVEGGGAFWSNPKDGLVRIIDGGSKTINYISLNNRKYIDRDSGTLNFGFDTNKSTNLQQMATRIAGELGRKWNQTDQVYTVGGQAEELAHNLKPYFPKATILQDRKSIVNNGEEFNLNTFANAIGYYNIGRTVQSNG